MRDAQSIDRPQGRRLRAVLLFQPNPCIMITQSECSTVAALAAIVIQ
jgi:hypothetical protein